MTQDHPAPAPGTPIDALDTPCLLLDEGRLDANLARMRARFAGSGVAFRPHLKTAKSIDVAKRALGAAPHGPVTVSTLKEAEVFAGIGVTDMIYAVGIAPAKLPRVQALRRTGVDIAVILDSAAQASAIAQAAKAGPVVPALIEIDSDGTRAGLVPEDTQAILALGKALHACGSLRGVLTHAGGSYSARTLAEYEAHAERERAAAVGVARLLETAGLPCPTVSVGSTPTALHGRSFEGLTEVRAGVFMFFDLVQAGIGVCTLDDIAISVLATVIGHRRDRGWIVVDAGWTAMSRDRGTAEQAIDQGYGVVCDLGGTPYGDLVMASASQEHGILALRPGSSHSLPDLPVGSMVRILPNHACATATQHDGYVLVRGGAPGTHGFWPRFHGW